MEHGVWEASLYFQVVIFPLCGMYVYVLLAFQSHPLLIIMCLCVMTSFNMRNMRLLQSNQDTANDILNVGLSRVIKGRPEHPERFIFYVFVTVQINFMTL